MKNIPHNALVALAAFAAVLPARADTRYPAAVEAAATNRALVAAASTATMTVAMNCPAFMLFLSVG